MTESFKNCGKKVFVIFADSVHKGEIFKTLVNARGVINGYRVRLPNTDDSIEARHLGTAIPVTLSIPKSKIFDEEAVADKALFIYKLKGET